MATESFFNKLHFSSQEPSKAVLKTFKSTHVEFEVSAEDHFVLPDRMDSLLLDLKFYIRLSNGFTLERRSEGISKDSAKAIRLAALRAIADKQLANFIEGSGTWEGYVQATSKVLKEDIPCT